MNCDVRHCCDESHNRFNQLTDFPSIMNRDVQRSCYESQNHRLGVVIRQAEACNAPVSCVDCGVIPPSRRIVAVPERHQIYVNRRPYYVSTRERLRKTFWTSINREDMLSIVVFFSMTYGLI